MANISNHSLTDKQLKVLIMRHKGMSVEKIARELNCTAQTVRSSEKIARAKILCMKETLKILEEKGIIY